MSYSDLIPFVSSLLLFALAGYSVRLARLFRAVRTGWLVFSSLAFLALLYLILLASPFRSTALWSVKADITYALISLVLLASMVRLEVIFKERVRKEADERRSVSEWEADLEKQHEKLTMANKELLDAKVKLEAELAAVKNLQLQTQNTSSELLTASGQTELELQQATASLREEVEQHKRKLEESEKTHQDQLAAARGVVEELGKTANKLQGDLDNLRSETDQRQAEIHKLQEKAAQQQSVIDQLQAELSGQELSREQAEKNQLEQAIQARKAGRTEVAGRVLCDIGKVLGNLDSVSLAATQLTQSSISQVLRNGKLWRDASRNSNPLAMRRSPRRKVLPDGMAQLARHLSDEGCVLVRRIDALRKKIEQLQAGVAVHQTDATVPSPADTVGHLVPGGNGSSHPPSDLSGASPVQRARCRRQQSPGHNGAETVAADLHEHLINNVTETGTESADPGQEVTESMNVDDDLIEASDQHVEA